MVSEWCILREGARVHTSTDGGEAGQDVRQTIGGGAGWTWRRRLLFCGQQKESRAVHFRYHIHIHQYSISVRTVPYDYMPVGKLLLARTAAAIA